MKLKNNLHLKKMNNLVYVAYTLELKNK